MLLRYRLLILTAFFPALAAARIASSTALAVNPEPNIYGQAVVLTATITSGATGKVTFYDGTTILGVAAVFDSQAKLSASMLPSGSRALRAYYTGDSTYAPSSSAILPHTVISGPSRGFRQPDDLAASARAAALAVGDFDGDGQPDFVIVDGETDVLRVFLGDGAGSFRAVDTYTAHSAARLVAVGDFNGDGHDDLVVANLSSPGISILAGNGDGTFQPAVSFSLGESADALAVGDFNGDGRADLAVVSTGGSSVSILLGNGDCTFQNAVAYPVVTHPVSIALADFNHNGHADIVLAGDGAISVLLGSGDGNFAAAADLQTGSRISAVGLADLNGDGEPDLVFSGPDGVSVLLGKGNGTFATAAHPVSYGAFRSAVVADFDGDGRSDIVAFDASSGTVVVLRGMGDGTFQPAMTYPAALSEGLLAVGDFNADGKTDLIVAGDGIRVLLGGTAPDLVIRADHGDGFTQGQVGGTYSVTAGNAGDLGASGPVTVSVTLPAGFVGTSLAGSGWDCNLSSLTCGRPDSLPAGARYPSIVATVNIAANLTGNATALFKLGGAGVEAADTVAIRHAKVTSLASPVQKQTAIQPTNGLRPPTSYAVGGSPYWVGVGDFNGDGIPDIVTLEGSAVTVLPGVGDGTFRAPVNSISGASNPNWGVVADFNHDGKFDVAVADGSNGLIILLGNGDGTFRSSVGWSSNFGCYSLIAADFNRDGALDLAAISNDIIYTFFGNGDGTFRPPTALPQSGYGLVETGDMNGDGLPDLIALSTGDMPSITVFLNTGQTTFEPVYVPYDYSDPIAFTVGDFNGDGKLDVALGYPDDVRFLPGNGDGTFGAYVQSPLTVPPQLLFAGDFNGDGNLDFAYTEYAAGSNFTLVFGNGNGTFPYTVTFPTDSTSRFLVEADLNGDGRPDIVAVNSPTGTVDVFLGTLYTGLSISSVHTGPFTIGQTGTYQITVGNPEFASTSGVVSVTDTLPAGLAAVSISGDGWNCTLNTATCTRSDALPSGNTYPPINLGVSISGSLTPSIVTNQATAGYSGTVGLASDATLAVLATTTSLAVSASPATLGQLVTLTAGVTPAATGMVQFSSGVTVLGTAILADGQAVFSTRLLPAGLNSLIATYSGDTTHALSKSAVQPETVRAAEAVGFFPKTTFSTGIAPMSVATADFNQDGTPDLVTANATGNTVSILLGKGDGTFGHHTDYPAGTQPSGVVVGDFNNDGKVDIAAASQSSPQIAILLGNGDGTFRAPLFYTTIGWPTPMAAGDIEGDGKTHLVVGALSISYPPLVELSVNADGTFLAEQIQLYSDVTLFSIGDFNSDNKTDVVEVQNSDLYVNLGNGDGTFQPWTAAHGPAAYALTICDLNGDGKADLVTADTTGVNVLLGNGDGTFQSPLHQTTGNESPALVCADINGDGHLDVVSLNTVSDLANILLGNGDGTLQAPVSYPTGANPRSLVAADFNGDGATDLAVANSQGSSLSILLGIALPHWQVVSSHIDPFGQGQIGASYTITVTNAGPNSTAGMVTLSDTLPSGLTATAISGTGWMCTLTSLTCTRSDALAAGESYSAVTVTMNVASNAPASVTNHVGVSGGSAVPASATDLTTVSTGPPITIQTNPEGLQFTIDGGAVQTTPWTRYLNPGAHTIAVTTLESGTTGTQYVFTGWSDSGAATHTISVGASAATYTATFQTQYQLTTTLNPGPGGSVTPASGSYYDSGSTVTLTATPNSPYVFTSWSSGATSNSLQVTMNAPISITATFNVPGFTCAVSGDTMASVADAQLMVNEALGAMPPNNDLNRDGVINVADVQKVINAVLGLGCLY